MDAFSFMKKTSAPVEQPSYLGENYVLTLTVPKSLHEPKYKEVLARVAQKITLPGFRKGKAPIKLVEDQVSKSALLDETLEAILPDLYSSAVETAKIEPLVSPQIKIISIEPGKDWIVEAHTALAPEITLGDWKKTVKTAGKEFHAKREESKEQVTTDKDQELLSAIFGKLIESITPKIPPLLIDQEVKRQIQEFARHLASHRMELEAYLQSTGTTVQSLQQEYTLSSIANLQVEFVLQAITKEIKPEVTEADVDEVLGGDRSKYSEEALKRLRHDAWHLAERRKTVEQLKELAKS